jgi:hypothetical protein
MRYLLALDMDLLALDEELDLQPINYLVTRHEQQQKRGEVVVLSLAATRQAKLSPLELVLGAATAQGQSAPAKYPTAPQPGHDVTAAAEHRMNLAVRHLKTIGYRASGLISDQELVKAVRAETRAHHYDEVILATRKQGGSWLARSLHRDPIHQLRRRWGNSWSYFRPARSPSRTSNSRTDSNAAGRGGYPHTPGCTDSGLTDRRPVPAQRQSGSGHWEPCWQPSTRTTSSDFSPKTTSTRSYSGTALSRCRRSATRRNARAERPHWPTSRQ